MEVSLRCQSMAHGAQSVGLNGRIAKLMLFVDNSAFLLLIID